MTLDDEIVPGSTFTRSQILANIAALEAERDAEANQITEAPRPTRQRRQRRPGGGTPRSDPRTRARLREAARLRHARRALAAGTASPLKLARIERKITQAEAAKLAGISERTWREVENGHAVRQRERRRIESAFPGVEL